MKDLLIGAGILAALYVGYKIEQGMAMSYQGRFTNVWPAGVPVYPAWAPTRYYGRQPRVHYGSGVPWTQARGRG